MLAHRPDRCCLQIYKLPQVSQICNRLFLMDLVGSAEIADRLGLTQSRINQLAIKSGFPTPVAELKGGRVWEWSAVEEWAASRERSRSDAS